MSSCTNAEWSYVCRQAHVHGAHKLMKGVRFTHSLLQQLFQAVNVWSVSSLPLHHDAVSAGFTQRDNTSHRSGVSSFGIKGQVSVVLSVLSHRYFQRQIRVVFNRGPFIFLLASVTYAINSPAFI